MLRRRFDLFRVTIKKRKEHFLQRDKGAFLFTKGSLIISR